ncbi:MAG: hypothetical protein ACR2OC_12940 [Solirubrobacterales bacterium]
MAGAGPEREDTSDPGEWVRRLDDQCRRAALEVRLRASADAEAEVAAILGSANGLIERRITRLRELRNELADTSARIERDMVRAATEIMRRSTELASPGTGAASPPTGLTYPPPQ